MTCYTRKKTQSHWESINLPNTNIYNPFRQYWRVPVTPLKVLFYQGNQQNKPA